jgi:pyridoxine/pyridoxamine 5'-phosphate oxidase
MYETAAEVAALQELLSTSLAGSTAHLRSIITESRALDAAGLIAALDGMKTLSVATVTARGEPRISALDGHFLHGAWTFSTSGTSAKARHLAARPAVSAAYIDGERFAVFAHGRADRLTDDDPAWTETMDHWTAHYGSSPLSWGDDIRMYRLRARWMVAWAATDES